MVKMKRNFWNIGVIKHITKLKFEENASKNDKITMLYKYDIEHYYRRNEYEIF